MKNQKSKVKKWIYWTPRIVSIIFILFLSIFSLDTFDSCTSFFNCLLGLLIHSIPVFILAILLWISWKRELVGAITFFLAGLLYIGLMVFNAIKDSGEWYMLSYSLIIAGPAFFIGYLFLLNYLKKKV